jgi:hypothetical protein
MGQGFCVFGGYRVGVLVDAAHRQVQVRIPTFEAMAA